MGKSRDMLEEFRNTHIVVRIHEEERELGTAKYGEEDNAKAAKGVRIGFIRLKTETSGTFLQTL